MIRQTWDPSVLTSYTWEPGALYRLPLASIERHEVMRLLWTGPWWVLEVAPGFFQVVGKSYLCKVLAIYVARVGLGDLASKISRPIAHMEITGVRMADPGEEKYFLEVSGGGAGE